MTPVEVTHGKGPIVLGLPHTGTHVPDAILANLNARGRGLDDTDWHIHRLYDGLLPEVTTVRATFHRYVIDANRDPSGVSLYPGQNTTGLVPLTDFDGNDLWTKTPDAAAIDARRIAFHAPYHAALEAELARVKRLHGFVILYDCHSIRSDIPFLFKGTLPDFNIGTDGDTTCAPHLTRAVQEMCAAATTYTSVTNGRFKGGWTTRHYGRPAAGQHAIQMELAQSTYLSAQADPWTYDRGKAAQLRPHLTSILTKLAELGPTLKGTP
ncbi:N-formylglutamate deformylase [Roseobacter sp.]|uniref:N-formylglutamate deformylase n=1 Tax=Roseobacter sp. TaxID=1907202 RepID=UPI003296C946